jgi:hypothetical protein
MRLASFHSRPAHQGATVKVKEKMMQKMRVRSLGPGSSALPSFFFEAQYSVAHAQDNPKRTRAAVACGNAIKKQCSGGPIGVPVGATSVLECFQKSEEKLSSRCAALANNVFRSCDRDAAQLCQGVVAGSQGNIVDCLTTAKNMVSSQCNAALDAAALR